MSERSDQIIVQEPLPRQRLDAYLPAQFPPISRGAFQRLIEEGHVTVNGRPVKPTHAPQAGDCIDIRWPAPKPAQAQPEEMALDILFEDSDLLVLNKAAGLVVHPGPAHDEHTLVNALLHHCRGQLSGIGGVARPGIVHRLDKDTSGCLVIAKNDLTHLALAKQFAERGVKKVYEALVCGEMPRSEGEIRAPIARHPNHRKRMTVTDGSGREAWTSYAVLERLKASTRVEAKLHTGRTHQIRVHFQHLGFPIVGDEMYGSRQNKRLKELASFAAARQLLHSRTLSFVHPGTEKRMEFEAPLPEDFLTALAALRPA